MFVLTNVLLTQQSGGQLSLAKLN